MTTTIKMVSGLFGLLAALLWFLSAAGDIPLAPGAAIGGTLPTEPFNVAMHHSATLNTWAAAATGASVLLMVVAEFIDLRTKVRAKQSAEEVHRP
jgi:hypothetical protein